MFGFALFAAWVDSIWTGAKYFNQQSQSYKDALENGRDTYIGPDGVERDLRNRPVVTHDDYDTGHFVMAHLKTRQVLFDYTKSKWIKENLTKIKYGGFVIVDPDQPIGVCKELRNHTTFKTKRVFRGVELDTKKDFIYHKYKKVNVKPEDHPKKEGVIQMGNYYVKYGDAVIYDEDFYFNLDRGKYIRPTDRHIVWWIKFKLTHEDSGFDLSEWSTNLELEWEQFKDEQKREMQQRQNKYYTRKPGDSMRVDGCDFDEFLTAEDYKMLRALRINGESPLDESVWRLDAKRRD